MRIKVAWKLLRQKAWTLSSGITSSTQKMFWEQYFYDKKAVEAIPFFKCCRSNTTYQGLPLLQTWFLDIKCLYTTFILDRAWNFIIHLHSFYHGYYSKYFSAFLPQSWLAQLPKGIFGSPQFALTKNVHCCFRHHDSCPVITSPLFRCLSSSLFIPYLISEAGLNKSIHCFLPLSILNQYTHHCSKNMRLSLCLLNNTDKTWGVWSVLIHKWKRIWPA